MSWKAKLAAVQLDVYQDRAEELLAAKQPRPSTAAEQPELEEEPDEQLTTAPRREKKRCGICMQRRVNAVPSEC